MERLELARRLGAGSRRAGGHAIIVEERDPGRFMAAFGGAVAASGTVLVMDPTWGAVERERFAALVKPQSADGESKSENQKAETEIGWLCLPTGGSSGLVRLARHDEDTLAAAVGGFGAHFQIDRINAVGVLPLHHVSGLMAWVRCALHLIALSTALSAAAENWPCWRGPRAESPHRSCRRPAPGRPRQTTGPGPD